MSNSSLVSYTNWSPHYDSRGGTKITDITIHHMAGNLTAASCGRVFQTREASAHYGITSNGVVGQYVDEKNAAWANANWSSNLRSVTIELANDQIGGQWHVSDKAIAKCIELCADICKRNGISYLNYTGTTSGNLTRHNMFVATTCPGPYLQSKFPYIAAEVNKKLKSSTPAKTKLEVDGIFGKLSVTAMQKWLGTTADGLISAQSTAVKPYIPAIKSVSWGKHGSQCIVALQKRLKNSGYNPGEIDGHIGKKTVIALQNFLSSKKCKPGTIDGIFGTNTAKAFQKYLNSVL